MAQTAATITVGGDPVAVRVAEGAGPPVVWCGGFRSDMAGGKASALARWGEAAGRRVVRFDYRGHGVSGGRFADLAVSDWLADARAVVDQFAPAGAVLVGSSMGGWIALLLARERLAAGRPLAGLVLIAPAADFTERLVLPRLPPDAREALARDGVVYRPSDYGEPYPFTRRLFEDGRQHLLMDRPIAVGCPVHILQGVRDEDVPHTHALALVERLAHDDVVLTLVKDGDHRLSREEDVARMIAAVEGIAG